MNKIIEFRINKINENKYTWAFYNFENKVIKESFEFEFERNVDWGSMFVTEGNTRLEYCISKRVGKHDPTFYLNLKDINKIFTVSKEEADDIKEILEEVNFRYNDFEEFLED